MGRRKIDAEAGQDYDLNKNFIVGSNTYTSVAASKLSAWFRMTNGTPTDLGPNSFAAFYANNEADASATDVETDIGGTSVTFTGSSFQRVAAIFGDSINRNATCEPDQTPAAPQGVFRMTEAAAGAAGTSGQDLAFSVSLWAKQTGNSGSAEYYFFGVDGGFTAFYKRGSTTTKNTLYFRLLDSSTSNRLTAVYADATNLDEWNHYVFTYDGSELHFF